MKTLRIYPQQLLTYSSVSGLYHVIHYIPSTYLVFNWSFVPFDHLYSILSSPTPSGNHKSDLSLFF